MFKKIAKKSALLLGIALINLAGIDNAIFADSKGPDVASWQHPNNSNINWLGVRLAGNEFAFVKATEGINYLNPYYVDDSIGIKAVGMLRGAYHFAKPNESPELQAILFAGAALGGRLPGDFPPVLDIEQTGGLKPAALVNWTHRFISTLETISGRRPIIYSYPSFWRTAMANTTDFKDYPLWIADYNNQRGPTLPLVGGWTNWTFWQYTSKGKIPGILGATDHSVFNGNLGNVGSFAFNFSNNSGNSANSANSANSNNSASGTSAS